VPRIGVSVWRRRRTPVDITQAVCACFAGAGLKPIHSVRHSPLITALSSLVTSLKMTKVDYCNIALASLPQCDLQQLQTVINAAARLTASTREYDHVTPLLKDLHWLRVPELIQYKLCVLTYRCLSESAPLSELVQLVANLVSRQRLRSSSSSQLVVPCTRHSAIPCTFAVAALCAWNSLPNSLQKLSSLNNFKKHFKSHLFRISLAQHDSSDVKRS